MGLNISVLYLFLDMCYESFECADGMFCQKLDGEFQGVCIVADIEDKFDEFITSPSVHHYRNKMEYGFSAIRYDHDLKTDVDEFALGFKKRGTWWCGENLDKDSGLFDELYL